VIAGVFPLAPQFMQALVVPAALLCGATADQVARGLTRWLGERRDPVNAVLLAGGLLYAAVVVSANQGRGHYHGLGHLSTIRQVVGLIVDDSDSRRVSRSDVFVCEDGRRDLVEYGRAYGYMFHTMAAAPREKRDPAVYMISDFVQSQDNRLGTFEGVGVYRYGDLAEFAAALSGHAGAVCHRTTADNIPFRTG
jgi:hypothetical protein